MPRGERGGSPLWKLAYYRWRCTLRRRWGAYAAVALLLGLVGGLAMGAVVAARRTQSAYPAYLASSQASDLTFEPGIDSNSFAAQLYSPSFTEEIARLPGVRRVAAAVSFYAAPLGSNGRAQLPAVMENNEVIEEAPVGDLFYRQERVVADEGVVPDPARADEFALSAEAARLLHWHVGQSVPLEFYSLRQLFATESGAPPQGIFRLDAELVGIVADAGNVVNDEVDAYPAAALFTPALTSRLLAGGAAGFTDYYLKLDDGPQGVSTVERELIGILPRGSTYSFRVTSSGEEEVERATEPESIALGAFGAIAAVAALVVVGLAVSRMLRADAADTYVLRALGATPTMAAFDSVLGILAAVVLGTIVAVGVCVALSPLAPLGVVREIDPSPGLDLDWTVLGVGSALFLACLSSLALVLTYSALRERPDAARSAPRRPSQAALAAERAGLPPSAVTGIRFALERGRGREAAPVGSALLGAVTAVAVVVTTLTFGNSLASLVSHPALYGWNWNYAIDEVGGGKVPPVTRRLLDDDADVASWTGFSFGSAEVDGETVPVMLEDPGASFGPPIDAGHGLQGRDEIVLGGQTLAQLHEHLGGTVVVSYGTPKDAPVYVPPTSLRIVGIATLPSIGSPGGLHVSMGTGAVLDSRIEPAAMQKALANQDPNLDGPAIVVVRLRPGVGQQSGLASLQRIARTTSAVIDRDPQSGGGTFVVLSVQQPAEIVNYRTMGDTPTILAGGLAFGAVVALGLTLVASVRRRRRELAVLKTLGLVPRQLSAVVSWQASVAALVGIVVGVPAGVLLGESLWRLFAERIFAVPDPAVPGPQIALACLLALALANLVALLPGRISARTPTAVLLHSE